MAEKKLDKIEVFLTQTIERGDKKTCVAAVVVGVVLANYLTDSNQRKRVYELREDRVQIRRCLEKFERMNTNMDEACEIVWKFLEIVTQIAQREPISTLQYIFGVSQISKRDERQINEFLIETPRIDYFRMALRMIVREAWGKDGYRAQLYDYSDADEEVVCSRMRFCGIVPREEMVAPMLAILKNLYL